MQILLFGPDLARFAALVFVLWFQACVVEQEPLKGPAEALEVVEAVAALVEERFPGLVESMDNMEILDVDGPINCGGKKSVGCTTFSTIMVWRGSQKRVLWRCSSLPHELLHAAFFRVDGKLNGDITHANSQVWINYEGDATLESNLYRSLCPELFEL